MTNITDKRNVNSLVNWEMLNGIIQILILLALPIFGWNLITTIEYGNRLAAIEANRFTSKDGKDMQQELSRVWQELSRMPKEVPPQWFLERVISIEERQTRFEDKLDDIDRLLVKLDQYLQNLQKHEN